MIAPKKNLIAIGMHEHTHINTIMARISDMHAQLNGPE